MKSSKFPPADIKQVIADNKYNDAMRLKLDKVNTSQITEKDATANKNTTVDKQEDNSLSASRKKEITPQQLTSALRQMREASTPHPSLKPKPSDLNRELTASEIEELKRMDSTI